MDNRVPDLPQVWIETYKGLPLRFKVRLKDFKNHLDTVVSLRSVAQFLSCVKNARLRHHALALDKDFCLVLKRYSQPNADAQEQSTLFAYMLTKSSLAQRFGSQAKSVSDEDIFLVVVVIIFAVEYPILMIDSTAEFCCLASHSSKRVYNILTKLLAGCVGGSEFLRKYELLTTTRLHEVYFSAELRHLRELLGQLPALLLGDDSVSFGDPIVALQHPNESSTTSGSGSLSSSSFSD